MTPYLVYDLHTGTYVCIHDDATIFGFQRVSRTQRINPIAIRVDQMDITLFGKTHVEDSRLFLDVFALSDLVAWLKSRKPNQSGKALFNALCRMVPGSLYFDEGVKAMLRLGIGLERDAQGDGVYFIEEAFAGHPEEWNELRAYRDVPPFQSGRAG